MNRIHAAGVCIALLSAGSSFGELKFNNFGGIVDLYPTGGGFHVSGGLFSNSNRIDLASTSPYVGIGWGRAGRVGFVFDVGALYQGSPKLRVQANPTNPALVPPSFYTNLEADRAKTEDDIREYRYYPVVSFGLSFGF